MNKIEKSIMDGLNNVTSTVQNWKLFSSRYVNENMELKSDKEKKLYNALCEFLNENKDSITVLPIKKFTTMFIDWDNEKLIENVNVLVNAKDLDKVLKYYWLENHLNLNRYFCLCMNNNDSNIYITSVCRESGIYKLKEKKENDTTENDTTENAELDTLLKIATLINSIGSLSKELENDTKIEILNQFKNAIQVKEFENVVKIAKSN